MTEKVLFVDDEPNVLQAIRRQLRGRFVTEEAGSGEQALERLAVDGPFAALVSDMRMPGMSGAELLARVRETSPDTVRVVLTGHADMDSALAAVNEGHVFQFLMKPCAPESLTRVLESALEHYRLVHAERELLERTLSGTVRLLTEILGLVNPDAFNRGSRVQRHAETAAEALGLADRWPLRLAAMFSQLGWITVPAEVSSKVEAGAPLSEREAQMVRAGPGAVTRLLSDIPRLEPVARILQALEEPANGWENDATEVSILRLSVELDRVLSRGVAPAAALDSLQRCFPDTPGQVLDAFKTAGLARNRMEPKRLRISELRVSMILDEDVMTGSGVLLVPEHQEVTAPMLARLNNFSQGVGVVEPIRVLVPRSLA